MVRSIMKARIFLLSLIFSPLLFSMFDDSSSSEYDSKTSHHKTKVSYNEYEHENEIDNGGDNDDIYIITDSEDSHSQSNNGSTSTEPSTDEYSEKKSSQQECSSEHSRCGDKTILAVDVDYKSTDNNSHCHTPVDIRATTAEDIDCCTKCRSYNDDGKLYFIGTSLAIINTISIIVGITTYYMASGILELSTEEGAIWGIAVGASLGLLGNCLGTCIICNKYKNCRCKIGCKSARNCVVPISCISSIAVLVGLIGGIACTITEAYEGATVFFAISGVSLLSIVMSCKYAGCCCTDIYGCCPDPSHEEKRKQRKRKKQRRLEEEI